VVRLTLFFVLTCLACSSLKKGNESIVSFSFGVLDSNLYGYRIKNFVNQDSISILDQIDNSKCEVEKERKFTFRNIVEVMRVLDSNQSNTKIITNLCVDQAGIGIYSEWNPESTAIVTPLQKKYILKAVMGYKTVPSNISCIRCSKLTIVLQKIHKID